MGFVGVELFQLGVKSNPGLCICFFLSLLPYWSRKTHAILLTNQVQNQSQSHPGHSRFFPAFFSVFIYLHSIQIRSNILSWTCDIIQAI